MSRNWLFTACGFLAMFGITTGNGYDHVGCYSLQCYTCADPLPYGQPAATSVEECAAACADHEFFGVKIGSQCGCSDSEDLSTQYGESSNCAGDGMGSDGYGGYALDLYRKTEYEHIGCYFLQCYTCANPLPIGKPAVTTVSACAGLCADYDFFGIKIGYQCGCATSQESATQYGESTNCAGNGLGSDGYGGYSMDVYRSQALGLPSPKLSYTFDNGIDAGLELRDGATVSDGVLNCNNGYAMSQSNIDFAFDSHSLEVRLKLSSFTGHGGAGIAIDSNYNAGGGYGHNQFDAIVFNERYPGDWMFGSDYFRRTQDLGGAAETVSGDWIHLVAVYDKENDQHVMYRNGVQYGNPYSPGSWFTGTPSTDAGQRVLFCIRHMRTETLRGSIDYGAVYDRALTADEVGALYQAAQSNSPKIIEIDYRPAVPAAPAPGPGMHWDWIFNQSSSVVLIAGLAVLLLVINLVMLYYNAKKCCGTKNTPTRYETVKFLDSDGDASEVESQA